MVANITLDRTKHNFSNVLELVDREGDVYIVKKNRTYHLHRELTEDEAVAIGKQANKEYKAGKTRSFKKFIMSAYPNYARAMEDNKN